VVKAEAALRCVDRCPGKREEVETVHKDKCLEREQRNMALAGGGMGIEILIACLHVDGTGQVERWNSMMLERDTNGMGS
jgi:hypothetical protein